MTKIYKELQLREREILRYAGCRTAEAELVCLMQDCLKEAKEARVLGAQLCFREYPLLLRAENGENVCETAGFSVRSEALAKNLQGCTSVLLLAVTAGVGIDRLIAKYGRIAPSKALMFQAIGAELVEQACDRFCEEYAQEQRCRLRPRFSPGYGDLPLESQKNLFAVLDCARRIGLTLNDSLLMSPSKSVTAFVGVEKNDGF